MRGRGLAAIGIGLGLLAVAGLALLAFIADGESKPPPLAAQTGSLLFMQAAPFLLSLLAFRVNSDAIRGGIWVGAGVVSVVLPTVIFSFVSLVILPGSIVLLVAGATTHGGEGTSRFLAATSVVFVAGALALTSWFLIREAHCWYRTGSGWDERPYSTVEGPIRVNSPGSSFQSVCGSAPTRLSIGLGGGVWLAAGIVTIVIGRRTGAPEPAPA